MKTKMCVLPVQCKMCKGVFDLWYDLQQQGISGEEFLLSHQKIGSVRMENFCRRCRKLAAEQAKLQEYQEYKIYENMNEDDRYELEFDFNFN